MWWKYCTVTEIISSPWVWKGVSATSQSGRYTLSCPRGRFVYEMGVINQYPGEPQTKTLAQWWTNIIIAKLGQRWPDVLWLLKVSVFWWKRQDHLDKNTNVGQCPAMIPLLYRPNLFGSACQTLSICTTVYRRAWKCWIESVVLHLISHIFSFEQRDTNVKFSYRAQPGLIHFGWTSN